MFKKLILLNENAIVFSLSSKAFLSWCLTLCTVFTSVHYAVGQIDPNEFPPGHPNVTVSPVQQLKTFPVPRYKQGHTLVPNFNWMDPMYLGGRFQPGITDAQAVTNSVDIQTELAKNFNYHVNVTWSSGDNFNTAWKNLANANPQYKVGLITYRTQTGTKVWSQTLPSSNYLQNSSGQFLDMNGSVTSNKMWRPTAPISNYVQDGISANGYIQSALSGLTNSVDLINDNGEVFSIYSNSAMALDPQVTAAKNASGLDWENFLAQKVKDNDVQAFRDQFMNLPVLSGAKFSQYRMDGHRDWNFRWEQMRLMSTPRNGQYYSTADFYVRWPSNWKDWSGPWHGLKWMTEARHYEIALGDKLFSPFIAAGWDPNPEADVRPAQWLGLLKLLGIYGAEFYFTGYFNEGNFNDPKGFVWQAVIPSYSQAVTSRYEDILRSGSLLPGDMIDVSHSPDIPYYQFNAGDSKKVVAIRKLDNANKYVITGTIQNSSNIINSTPLSDNATITLNGQTLKFKIRRQGSTYIYNNSIPSAPVFYQIDEWHESKHPYHWTKDFNFEAEVFDNVNSNAVIKTKVPAGTPAGDFTNATSYVSFTTASDVIYNFQPRGLTTSNYYLWVRVRSKDGTSTGFTTTLDGANPKQFNCITDTNWVWYRFNTSNQAVVYPNLSLTTHSLKITPSNTKLEIDKISIVTSSSAVYGNTASPCTASAYITPSGPTTFCAGGSVTLTANSGSGYLWSTGSTAQSINVSTSGNYTVTVTVSGTPAISSPTNVTVNPLPVATITAGGATTFCQGGNVALTSSSGSAYLWNPGNQTTSSINVSTSGNYTVRVTNSSGCSATSLVKTVTVNPLPNAIITPSGSLNINQGATVTLTASSGSSYLWLPGGQTSQSITVGTAGSYTVRVTNSNGCSKTSSPAIVTIAGGTLPVTITASGSTIFCQGGSVNLTATTGTSYLWSSGQTTKTITVTTSGTYTVTVYSGPLYGTSAPKTVTVNPLPSATISANGATTFCQGGNVTLTSSNGFAYLWFPYGQTTSSITVSSAGSYSVRVTNSYGCSSTSSPVNIVVNNCSCPIPTGLYSTGVTATYADLHWSQVTGVDSLQIRLNNLTTGLVYITGMFRGTYNQITVGIQSNSVYHWKIRSKCGATVTNWSSPFATFTTPPLREGDNLPLLNTSNLMTLTLDRFDKNDFKEEFGSKETDLANHLDIYPNPASGKTTLSFTSQSDEQAKLKLLDFTGKVILEDNIKALEGTNYHFLDLKKYPKGVYLVMLKLNGALHTKKVLVE